MLQHCPRRDIRIRRICRVQDHVQKRPPECRYPMGLASMSSFDIFKEHKGVFRGKREERGHDGLSQDADRPDPGMTFGSGVRLRVYGEAEEGWRGIAGRRVVRYGRMDHSQRFLTSRSPTVHLAKSHLERTSPARNPTALHVPSVFPRIRCRPEIEVDRKGNQSTIFQQA